MKWNGGIAGLSLPVLELLSSREAPAERGSILLILDSRLARYTHSREWQFGLSSHKRQQSHVARVLQRSGDHALVLWARTSAFTSKNFSMRGHKAAQGLRIFIIYCADFVSTEVTNFFYNRLVVTFVISAIVIVIISWHVSLLNWLVRFYDSVELSGFARSETTMEREAASPPTGGRALEGENPFRWS